MVPSEVILLNILKHNFGDFDFCSKFIFISDLNPSLLTMRNEKESRPMSQFLTKNNDEIN